MSDPPCPNPEALLSTPLALVGPFPDEQRRVGDDAYANKYKTARLCFDVLGFVMEGKYVNFGVMDFYGACILVAVRTCCALTPFLSPEYLDSGTPHVSQHAGDTTLHKTLDGVFRLGLSIPFADMLKFAKESSRGM